MKMKTSAMPMAPARMLCCRKFRPSVALILLKLTSSMDSGSAPYLSTVTSWLTSDDVVNEPEIWPLPPKLARVD